MVEGAVIKGVDGSRAVVRPVPSVAAAAAAVPAQPVRAPVPEPDTTRLSGVAAQLAATPPVDPDRVAQIKKAIADGTFPILPATIADTLLALRYDWLSHDEA